MHIGIIGGGASGMAAAIAAAGNPQVRVTLLERQARLGRKLQATGNGRCNLTNRNVCLDNYHGDESDFANHALHHFSVEETLQWFADLGLYTATEESGKVYPYSDQANSVVDILRFGLEKENISVVTGCEVTRLRRSTQGFEVGTTADRYFFDRVIVACGGLAGSKLGGSMSGYQLLRSMGHEMTKLRPALVQLKSNWSGCVSLKGVRANCTATITRDGAIWSQGTGEMQFTEYGLSGPVIFEISRDVCQGKGAWLCTVDLTPELPDDALMHMLWMRKGSVLTTEDLLTGIVHNRLGRVITAAAGIKGHTPIAELTADQLQDVCRLVKRLQIPLTEPMGMDSAQVTAGGMRTAQWNPQTMESRLVPGLYACGEVLDIDGDCGGYNLQWAWSSGRLAGTCAGGVNR